MISHQYGINTKDSRAMSLRPDIGIPYGDDVTAPTEFLCRIHVLWVNQKC